MTNTRSMVVATLLSAGLALSSCASNALTHARTADQLRDHDVAVAEYMKVLRNDPDNREAQLGLDRARLRASDAHHQRGRRLASQGRYEDALLELQLAVELNPTQASADEDLRAVRAAMREALTRPPDGQTALEALLARSSGLAPAGSTLPDVSLPAAITTGESTSSRDLYLLLAKLTGLSVTFDQEFRDTPAQVALRMDLPLDEALTLVGAATRTFHQVSGDRAIMVANDTPAKRQQYADEILNVFYVQNANLDETMNALRVAADMRTVSPITGTNAIVVRDTPERVRAVGRFIRAFDKARPELVVNVEVLEVDRTRLREYGLKPASPGSPGLDGAISIAGADQSLSLESLRSLTQADVLITNIPALFYRLLKTDQQTRTLANPHIRMSDGIAAAANFGQEVPVPRTVIVPITQGGANLQPQTSFEYRNIGVNIGITPRTHANDEITLELSIELSSLAGAGFDGLPTFGQRNITTTIRLRDGETNILAGLIRDDERTTRESIPGLGDIPVLGALFSHNRTEVEQTDVVIMLTPHIIRGLALTEDDLRGQRLPMGASGFGSAFPVIIPPDPIIRDPGGPGRGGGGTRPNRR